MNTSQLIHLSSNAEKAERICSPNESVRQNYMESFHRTSVLFSIHNCADRRLEIGCKVKLMMYVRHSLHISKACLTEALHCIGLDRYLMLRARSALDSMNSIVHTTLAVTPEGGTPTWGTP